MRDEGYKHEESGAVLYQGIALPDITDFNGLVEGFTRDKTARAGRRPTPTSALKVGPSVWIDGPEGFHYGYGSVADCVLSAVAKRDIGLDDRMTIKVIDHKNGWSLVTADYSTIIGSVWLAYVRSETVPAKENATA